MSIDLHELLDIAARTLWRFLGARSQSSTLSAWLAGRGSRLLPCEHAPCMGPLRQCVSSHATAWAVCASSVRHTGQGREHGVRRRRGCMNEEWAMRSAAAFHAHAGQRGGFARSARRGAPYVRER